LKNLDRRHAAKLLPVVVGIVEELNGGVCLPLELAAAKKIIACSRSFERLFSRKKIR